MHNFCPFLQKKYHQFQNKNLVSLSAGLSLQGHQSSSVEMMSLVGLCLLPVDKKAAYKEAIKAVHCYPERLEPWCVLLKATNDDPSVLAQTKAVRNLDEKSSNKPLAEWIDTQL